MRRAPPPQPDERLGQVANAVINSTVDTTGAYAAVGTLVGPISGVLNPLASGGCGATVIAKDAAGNAAVALTSGHCVAQWLTRCVSLDPTQPNFAPLGVMFANPTGGFASLSEASSRIVPVELILPLANAVSVPNAPLNCPFLCGQTPRSFSSEPGSAPAQTPEGLAKSTRWARPSLASW